MHIFDFDGTLIHINSFPKWIIHLTKRSILSFRFDLTFLILKLIFRRKITRRISHAYFKERLLKLAIPDEWNKEFALHLKKFTNALIVNELRQKLISNRQVIVSSAAPEQYLIYFFDFLFPEIKKSNLIIIGSILYKDKLLDNYKEEKKSRLFETLHLSQDSVLETLYTDSLDDMPLALIVEKTYLVNPGNADLLAYINSKLVIEIINC